jgi:type IV secretory pathway VirB10-like protein
MAALILATVLSLVYFVSTQRGVQSVAPAAVDSITTTPVVNQPAPVVESAAIVNEEPKPGPAKARTPTATKKASAKTPTTQNRTVERKKEENKVGSILKKTGRILKKPFKL